MDVAVKVVNVLEGVSICSLRCKDVVRHPLVQKIVRAYEEYEKKNNPKGKNGRGKNREFIYGNRDRQKTAV